MKEFVTAFEQMQDENAEEETPIEFKVDGRVLRAYKPTEGQLVFMMASLGRGQSAEGRFAAMINIMLESLEAEDKDYLEGRLLDRNPKTRLQPSMIEQIFEYLSEEWFGRPTQSPSGSASSEPNGGQNSTPAIETSRVDSSEPAQTAS